MDRNVMMVMSSRRMDVMDARWKKAGPVMSLRNLFLFANKISKFCVAMEYWTHLT